MCAFLVANEVPQGLIRKLAHTNQITLRDKKARYEWDRLAVLLCNNEEKRGTYKSHNRTESTTTEQRQPQRFHTFQPREGRVGLNVCEREESLPSDV